MHRFFHFFTHFFTFHMHPQPGENLKGKPGFPSLEDMDGAMKSRMWSCETLQQGLDHLEKQKVDVKNEQLDIDQELNVPLFAKGYCLPSQTPRV